MAVDNSTTDTVDSNDVDLSKVQADFVFRAPIEMRMKAEEAAQAAKTSLSDWLRQVVATNLGYQLPATTSRGAVLTDEQKAQRLADQRAKDKAARELSKSLLAAHKKQIAADANNTDGTPVPAGT